MEEEDGEGLTILGALEELKNDIQKMQEKHDDNNKPMFFIEEGELELKLVATKKVEGETGFKLYIFNSGIHGNISSESIQTLKIKFKGYDGSLYKPKNKTGMGFSRQDTSGVGINLPPDYSPDINSPVVETDNLPIMEVDKNKNPLT